MSATTKNNIKIGEYLGAKFWDDDKIAYPNGYYVYKNLPYNPEDWCYHESMDWLLPVVNKIKKKHDFDISISGKGTTCIIREAKTGIIVNGLSNNNPLPEIIFKIIVEFLDEKNKK